MPEKFANFGQRRSLPEHLAGECVAELVGTFARRINSGSFQPVPYNRTDPTLTLETSCGRFCPEKHESTAGGWPSLPQVISDGRSDIDRKWQLRITTRLPAYRNQSLLPIKIFQSEHSDLAGPQTKACQDQKNRIVTAAHGRFSVDGSQHPL